MDNNRGHFINAQNISAVNFIVRVEKYQPLLHLIGTENNNQRIAVTFKNPEICSNNTEFSRTRTSISKQTYLYWKFENRKIKCYKPHKYIQSYVKDKDTIMTYEAISPIFSAEISKLKKCERSSQ